MLPNSAIVLEAIAAPHGVLANARAKTIVMDMSTVAPEVSDQLAQAVSAGLDAAFLGGEAVAVLLSQSLIGRKKWEASR